MTEPSKERADDAEILLSVEHLSKKFCRSLKRSLFYGMRDIASEVSGMRQETHALRAREFWALDDVSFQLRRGASLGLIGENGAGKTTLLRAISGLVKPDAGRVRVKGRVAPLIALGAGFNPVLSGRENVFVNMSILGLSNAEIKAHYEGVVDFAGIGDAIDAPLKTYSSGMAARLGFACAIHTNPDLLLVDEVLAVGDIHFRSKCYRQLAKMRTAGTSLVLVSHSSTAILSICESSIYLANGRLAAAGATEEVMKRYEEDLTVGSHETPPGEMVLPERSRASGLQIRELRFTDAAGAPLRKLRSGEPAQLEVGCHAYEPLEEVSLSIIVDELAGENSRVLFVNSAKDGMRMRLQPGDVTLCLRMPYCGFKPGLYTMKIHVLDGAYYNALDAVESFVFKVTSDGSMSQCAFHQPRDWQLKYHGEGRRRSGADDAMKTNVRSRAKAFLKNRLAAATASTPPAAAQDTAPKGLLYEVDEFFQRVYGRALEVTGTLPDSLKRRERHYNLMQFFQQTLSLSDGLMVECGCWNGLSSLVMCEYLRARRPEFKGEGFHIFDSFEGLSEPTAADTIPAKTIAELKQKFGTVAGAFRARLEDVRAALSEFPKIDFHRGWLPTSLEGQTEARYRFVHIDVDLYEPTLGAVAYFYPRLVEGGLIICDDYGSLAYPGARRAIDEYSAAHHLWPLTISTAQAVLWKR